MYLKQLQPADFTTLDIAYQNILGIMKNEVFSGKLKKILLSGEEGRIYKFHKRI